MNRWKYGKATSEISMAINSFFKYVSESISWDQHLVDHSPYLTKSRSQVAKTICSDNYRKTMVLILHSEICCCFVDTRKVLRSPSIKKTASITDELWSITACFLTWVDQGNGLHDNEFLFREVDLLQSALQLTHEEVEVVHFDFAAQVSVDHDVFGEHNLAVVGQRSETVRNATA